MGGVLDRTYKCLLIKSAEIVDDQFVTDSASVDRIEGPFSISLTYENLVGTLTSVLEVSVDGKNYSEVPNTENEYTDVTGTHIYDISSTGVSHIRVKFIGSGSLQLNNAILVGSRRH